MTATSSEETALIGARQGKSRSPHYLPDANRRNLAERRLAISFSQGAEWKTLINTYISAIPLSGAPPCAAEQRMSAGPP
jgi:hypothetical protein